MSSERGGGMAGVATATKKSSQLKEIWRRLKKNRTAMIGFVFVCLLLVVALFADVICPYARAVTQDGSSILQRPGAGHIFGTDAYGRDIFARIIHGSRVSLTLGLLASLIAFVAGSLLGAAAGYFGGKVDIMIMRIMDMFASIPPMLLALAIVSALGPNLINLLLAISISSTPGSARLVRSVVMSIADNEFVEAALSYGASHSRIILKYILPNAVGPIIVNMTMNISSLILSAAALSFVGMGVQPPRPEWGAMLSEAREFMRHHSYMLVFPGCAIMVTALSFNLFGDGLRDALDPKLKD